MLSLCRFVAIGFFVLIILAAIDFLLWVQW